jgi:MSHA pilin protein MshD
MCTETRPHPRPSGQRGLTFVELVFFMVIVAVGLAGILSVLNVTTSRSADPLIRKQMLAIAEGVMEEVRLQSFGWCDPDDANFTTAVSAAGCAGGTPAETRGNAVNPWDQVTDYNGAAINSSLAGTAFPPGYGATVQVLQADDLGGVAGGEALRIQVTVTFGAETFVLEGYRTRYAPNATP